MHRQSGAEADKTPAREEEEKTHNRKRYNEAGRERGRGTGGEGHEWIKQPDGGDVFVDKEKRRESNCRFTSDRCG